MNKKFFSIKKVRVFLLNLLTELTVEELNEIPEGFNNNIIWNLGHLIAAQQGICYIRAGLQTATEEKYFLTYKTGTKPEGFVDQEEVDKIKQLLLSSIDQTEIDYENQVFSNYTTWTTRYGNEMSSIDDAIDFVLFHEGLHSGIIMALKRIVKK